MYPYTVHPPPEANMSKFPYRLIRQTFSVKYEESAPKKYTYRNKVKLKE
ncbi:MAG: hypothetical protein QXG52_07305 [Candidatus Caldarchaeum sp.]